MLARFSLLFLLALASLAMADRRGSSSSVIATPFSYAEQALFGQSHSEDCLFGSSTSVFSLTEEEEDWEVVKEVKATSPQPERVVGSSENIQSPKPASFGLPQPAFVKKP